MNILFLSYWGINEGLTASTVFPHLEILDSFEEVEMIVYCSIEREGGNWEGIRLPSKVRHIPLFSGKNFLDKFNDFTKFPQILKEIVSQDHIDILICRGTPAGALGFPVHRELKIPYCVESFEPHAEYMAESGVWSRWGLRYGFLKYREKKQRQTAMLLMPVANNMVLELGEKGVEQNRIALMPCAVKADVFAFSAECRTRVRANLGIKNENTVGIYVGKFGGLYYDSESFEIFKIARSVLNNFRLIILSPDDPGHIEQNLVARGFSRNEFNVLKAPHNEVPSYLSASDMAFALYKKSPSKKFLSPIKVGEYWANGLPVLITEGTGDDAAIIEKNNAGATFDLTQQNVEQSLVRIKTLLESGRGDLRDRVQQLAVRYRSIEINKEVYRKLIQMFSRK